MRQICTTLVAIIFIFIIRLVYLKNGLSNQSTSDRNGDVDHKPVNGEVGNSNKGKSLTKEKNKKVAEEQKHCFCM